MEKKMRKGVFLFLLGAIVIVFGFTDVGSMIELPDILSIDNTSDRELDKNEVIISRVIDGDTIQVIMPDGSEESIRLLLVDTPESVHPDQPEQKFGSKASDFAKKTLKEGDIVTLEKGDPVRDDC